MVDWEMLEGLYFLLSLLTFILHDPCCLFTNTWNEAENFTGWLRSRVANFPGYLNLETVTHFNIREMILKRIGY